MTQFKPKKFIVPPDKRYHYDVFQVISELGKEEVANHVCPTGKEEEANAIVEALATMDYVVSKRMGIKFPVRYVTRARAKEEHTVFRVGRRDVEAILEEFDSKPQPEVNFYYEPEGSPAVDITDFIKGGYGKCDDPGCACRTPPSEALYTPNTTWLSGEELSRDTPEVIKAKRVIRAAKKKRKK